MNILKQIAYVFILLVNGAALLFLVVEGSGLSLSPSPNVSGSEFVSIILSALGVVLAAVTVLLGILAIIGWATFESRVEESAKAFLSERFRPGSEEYDEVFEKIKGELLNNLESSVQKRFSEEDPRFQELVEDLKRRALSGTAEQYAEENSSIYDEDAS